MNNTIIRLVISLVLLIVLAVLIVLNLEYATTFNFFGSKLDNIPVIVIALLSFVLGVVYSFLYYFINLLAKKGKTQRNEKKRFLQILGQ